MLLGSSPSSALQLLQEKTIVMYVWMKAETTDSVFNVVNNQISQKENLATTSPLFGEIDIFSY